MVGSAILLACGFAVLTACKRERSARDSHPFFGAKNEVHLDIDDGVTPRIVTLSVVPLRDAVP